MRVFTFFAYVFFVVSIFSAPFVSATQVDLIEYLSGHVNSNPVQASIPKYNRLKDFGGWAHQNNEKTCFNTRESVLARAESVGVTMQLNSNGCTIKSGAWVDPYTGTTFETANDVQIDHVVPLEVAYYAGAYAWAPALRCNYANFMANDFHLLAVSGHENMAKGDKGPDQYLPPLESEHCAYVSDWLKIKAIWQLTATDAEVRAIQNIMVACPMELRSMDDGELTMQRAAAATPIAACANFAPRVQSAQAGN